MAFDVSIAVLQTTIRGCSKHGLIFWAPRQPLTRKILDVWYTHMWQLNFFAPEFFSFFLLHLNFLCNIEYYDRKEPVISMIIKWLFKSSIQQNVYCKPTLCQELCQGLTVYMWCIWTHNHEEFGQSGWANNR